MHHVAWDPKGARRGHWSWAVRSMRRLSEPGSPQNCMPLASSVNTGAGPVQSQRVLTFHELLTLGATPPAGASCRRARLEQNNRSRFARRGPPGASAAAPGLNDPLSRAAAARSRRHGAPNGNHAHSVQLSHALLAPVAVQQAGAKPKSARAFFKLPPGLTLSLMQWSRPAAGHPLLRTSPPM